jgi:hypothetical protein
MTKETGNIFMAKTDHIQHGTFSVNKVDTDKIINGAFDGNYLEPIFEGDQSRASELFGWALTVMAMKANQDVLMLFAENESVVFPDGVNIK